jgi:hypothetical protein
MLRFLQILLDLGGYQVPSMMHDAKVCLGIASLGEKITETCFPQVRSTRNYSLNATVID